MHTTPKTNYNVNDALDLTTDGTTPEYQMAQTKQE